MSKSDILLKKANYFEKIALYSDRSAFLQAIAQVEPASDYEEIALPQDIITSYPTIPEDVQDMLSQIVTIDGIGFPLKIDGLLGPKTRQAINAFKTKLSIPDRFTDASVFDVIKSTYNRNLDKYGK